MSSICMQRGRAENMTKCFIKHCDGKAKYTIKDAEQHPKKYNGKKERKTITGKPETKVEVEPEVNEKKK